MRDFFKSSLQLHLRLMKQPLVTLVVMVVAALIISMGAAAVGSSLLAGRPVAGVKIAVADNNSDGAGLQQLTQFTAKDTSGYFISLVKADTPEEAIDMLARGEVSAAMVLPADLMDSATQTELYLDPGRPLDMLLVQMFVESANRMLSATGSGVDYVMYVYGESGATTPERETVQGNIRVEYSFWILGRETMYRDVPSSPTGAMDTIQYYLLNAITFFSLLATPILFGIYSFRQQKAWTERLRSAGGSLRAYGVAKILCGTLVTTVMLALFLAGAAWFGNPYGLPTPALLVGLLLCACFLSCFAFLCCNTGSVLSSTLLTFLLSSAGLYVAGGLVPPVLLPGVIRTISPYSPLSWMRAALAPVFGLAADWGAMLALLALTVLLFMGCLLYCWRLERRWSL